MNLTTRKEAEKHAAEMTTDGEPWLVFKTPNSAHRNPLSGPTFPDQFRYGTCKASERASYEARGAEFI